MSQQLAIRFHITALEFQLACLQVTEAFNLLAAVFEDRDKWYAITEGQWPDRFVLLNRFVRTGLRPPFIFND